jgi:WD40 repeat protein
MIADRVTADDAPIKTEEIPADLPPSLSESSPISHLMDTSIEVPNTGPDDSAMQVDFRNLSSEAHPPTIRHLEGDGMVIDDAKFHGIQTDAATVDAELSAQHSNSDKPSSPDAMTKVEPEVDGSEVKAPEEVTSSESEAFNFESTGRYECRLILSGHTLSISALKFSPDGTMLASSGLFVHLFCSRFIDAGTEASR